MSTIYRVDRRQFLRQAGVGTGALVFGCSIGRSRGEGGILNQVADGFPVEGIPFVAIKLNGDIVIITHRSEMGQGIRSSLAAVLADEMEADWNRVTLRQADADSLSFGIPYPFQIPGQPQQYLIHNDVAQFTDGSRSMASYFMPMRLFGAAIRVVMERAAALKLGVDPAECRAREHKVYHEPSGDSVDYGRLLLHARKTAPPMYEEVVAALKTPDQWRFIGTNRTPLADAHGMVTGQTQYCADLRLPGMLTAMIERCPVANGDVKSFDATEALKVPGVLQVIHVRIPGPLGPGGVGTGFLPHAGVAVVAKSTWAAWQGRQKLVPTIVWDLSSPVAQNNAAYDSATYRRHIEKSTAMPGKVVRNRGDVDQGFVESAKIVEAAYYVPHFAQAAMEPPVAVALLKRGHLEVWAPTQNPDSAQHLAGVVAFGIPWEQWDLASTREQMRRKVTLHMPLLGGGFGRKSKPDYVAEAAFLAAQNPGTPVRVQWTREDDLQFSYHSAVSHQYLKAGLDADGRATTVLQRSAFPSFFGTIFPPPRPDWPEEINKFFVQLRTRFHDAGSYPYASGVERAQGLEDMPFDVPNLRLENCPAENHIRVGWMRSVINVFHAFAIGSFADELAAAARRDSKDYLLELIGAGKILRLETEGVAHFNNNEFPVAPVEVPIPGGLALPVIAGYPPDTRRLRHVVEKVARLADWDARKRDLPKGRGLGIAAHRTALTYVALVFDVSLSEDNHLTINEAFCAVDCGLAVNVDRVRAQIEGGINYGLSMALLGQITVEKGAVQQSNFDNYHVLRINQTPRKITIQLVDSGHPPTGVGEPPTPVVAPALANAIVAAGGPRIREIPFRNHLVI